MMQDAMAAVMEMQKDEHLGECTVSELVKELAKRSGVAGMQERGEESYQTTLIIRTKEKIF